MAEAAVGTKSLRAMFAAALAAPDKIIVATNNPSDIIPSHKLKELWEEQDKHCFQKWRLVLLVVRFFVSVQSYSESLFHLANRCTSVA